MTARIRSLLLLSASWAFVMALVFAVSSWFFQAWVSAIFPFSLVFSHLFKAPYDLVPMQYTRKGFSPEDYVAILGDSYAFGQGDGLNRLQGQVRPAFNVTHLLHASTGIDLVSFGVPSSSSIASYLGIPLSHMPYIHSAGVASAGDPAAFVLYFYEGNDIEENVADARKLLSAAGYTDGDLQRMATDQDFFDEVFRRSLPEKPDALALSQVLRMWRFFYHSVLFVSGEDPLSETFRHLSDRPAEPGKINRILLDGREQPLFDGVQGPSMLLGEEDTRLGFLLLERTLAYFRRVYPAVPVVMVAVPSPATVYRFASTDVVLWDLLGIASVNVRPSQEIRPRSNRFCQQASALASASNVMFHDARPALVAHGEQRMLHGPVDVHHLNLEGYRVLAEDIGPLVVALHKHTAVPLRSCVELQ